MESAAIYTLTDKKRNKMWVLIGPASDEVREIQVVLFRQEYVNSIIFLSLKELTGVNKNIFTANLYAVAVHSHGWVLADFARGDVVLPPMPGTRHDVAVHDPLP